MDALQRTWDDAQAPEDREHVTTFIRNNKSKFKMHLLKWEKADWIYPSLTVDTEEDFRRIDNIIARVGGDGTNITLDHLKR